MIATALLWILMLVSIALVVSYEIMGFDGVANWLIERARRRRPDLVIGSHDNPYMFRWAIFFPKNLFFNIYVHRIVRDDDDRALHDHPWASMSIILRGHYFDIVPRSPRTYRRYFAGELMPVRRDEGDVIFRSAGAMHRIVLPGPKKSEAWSLFITGPETRTWGFYCPSGWRSSRDFAAKVDGASVVGRGCE